jgi:hypothetical protein
MSFLLRRASQLRPHAGNPFKYCCRHPRLTSKSIHTIQGGLKSWRSVNRPLISTRNFSAGASQDYYKTLGLQRGASDDAIKKAYRKKAMEWHPDTNAGRREEAEETFKTISEAYHVLSDKTKRQQYDTFGSYSDQQNPFGGGGSPFGGDPRAQQAAAEAVFKQFFQQGGMPGGMGGFPAGGSGQQQVKQEMIQKDGKMVMRTTITTVGADGKTATRTTDQEMQMHGFGGFQKMTPEQEAEAKKMAREMLKGVAGIAMRAAGEAIKGAVNRRVNSAFDVAKGFFGFGKKK